MEMHPAYFTDEGHELIEALFEIAKSNEEGEDDLVSATKGLRQFLLYLEMSPTLRESGVLRPLRKLAYALRDLAEGSKPPLLFDRPPRRNAPPTDTSQDIIRGNTAAALEILIRAGEDPESASRFVAKELSARKIRLRNGKPIEAKQIQNWRHSVGATKSSILKTLYDGLLSAQVRAGWVAEKGAKSTEHQVAGARAIARGMVHGLWQGGF